MVRMGSRWYKSTIHHTFHLLLSDHTKGKSDDYLFSPTLVTPPRGKRVRTGIRVCCRSSAETPCVVIFIVREIDESGRIRRHGVAMFRRLQEIFVVSSPSHGRRSETVVQTAHPSHLPSLSPKSQTTREGKPGKRAPNRERGPLTQSRQ